MAQMLSPGVYIEEQDASAIQPNVAANIAFLGGSFTDGPLDSPFPVTNKQEYEDTFGYPTDINYNEWFQGYKFFDYGNQLIVTRGVMLRPDTLTSAEADEKEAVFTYSARQQAVIPLVPDYATELPFTSFEIPDDVNATEDIKIYMPADPGAAIVAPNQIYLTLEHVVTVTSLNATDEGGGVFSVTATADYNMTSYVAPINSASDAVRVTYSPVDSAVDTSTQAMFTLDQTPNNELGIGDWVRFDNMTEVGQVLYFSQKRVEYTNEVGNPDSKIQDYLHIQLNTQYSNIWGTGGSGKLYPTAQGHFNAGSQANVRGAVVNDAGYMKPVYANAIIPSNIDVQTSISGLPAQNINRLNYNYELIKNHGEFTHLYDINALQTFESTMKLKFYSKTPTATKIEIAIANYYDFYTDLGGLEENDNFAVAFADVDANGGLVNKVYLRTLFEYEPQVDELAIAIRKNDSIETFIVSLDPLSVDGNNKNNYIETVLNEQSSFVYVVDNTALTDYPASYLVLDRFGDSQDNLVNSTSGVPTENIVLLGGKTPILDYGSYEDAYSTVLDKEEFEIDVIIGNEQHVNIAIELADKRKDCIAYIGARYQDTVGFKANIAVEKIRTWKKGSAVDGGVKPTTTMFAALFTNYFRIFDKYNKKYRWINVAGDMAGIRCDVTSNNAPWWVSAGMKRGIIRAVNKIAFTPSLEQRDNLYKEGMNPIVAFPGTGNLVWGNKTLHPIASSFDRINVRTLFNTLERSMSKAARSQVFEFNDPYTRNAMLSMFNPYLATIKAGRGIVDYLVICDETNNTPDVISRNELRVDIYIKPNYAAEMILLTFTNVGTRSFSDVVGV